MYRAASATDKGRERTTNEDYILCNAREYLYAVADGVGGHKAGELASRMAIEYIEAFARKNPIKEVKTEKALMTYFSSCLEGVNQVILRQAAGDGRNAGMATTVVLAHLKGDTAYVVNIGDSRAYLLREENLMQITEDHTYVNELLKKGSITKDEAINHPERNMITRALGSEEKLMPDYYSFPIYPGDRILLCSDGLYNEIEDQEIKDLSDQTGTLEGFVHELVHVANQHGGRDNISVVCVEVISQKKESINE